MTSRILSSLPFTLQSPSLYDLRGLPISIAFVRTGWVICYHNRPCHAEPFESVAAAAEVLAMNLRAVGRMPAA